MNIQDKMGGDGLDSSGSGKVLRQFPLKRVICFQFSYNMEDFFTICETVSQQGLCSFELDI